VTDADPPGRPAPILTEDNHEFWDAAREGRLVAQQCRRCGRLRHPPRPMCPNCQALDHDIVDLAGTGVVYSYSLLHYPQHPAFTYPVVAVLVDLDEGIRIVSNLVGVEPHDVQIGMPVRARFAPTQGDMAVPVFAPAKVAP
jgi:uncharacterized OB-fold protein